MSIITNLEIAALCWCDEETSHIVMDVALAEAFTKRLDEKDNEIETLREQIEIHKSIEAQHTAECNRLIHENDCTEKQRNIAENKALEFQQEIETLRLENFNLKCNGAALREQIKQLIEKGDEWKRRCADVLD